MTRIRICGITCPQDVELVNKLKPDDVGFVFIKGNNRYIDLKTAEALKKQLDPSIHVVGIFENERPIIIATLLRMGTIDAVQFSGSETDEDIMSLRRQFDCPIYQVFQVESPKDALRAEWSIADMVLLRIRKGAEESLPWNLTKFSRRPFILAGDLSPETVGEAMAHCHPFAVDLGTGIRTEEGIHPEMTTRTVEQIRKFDAEEAAKAAE